MLWLGVHPQNSVLGELVTLHVYSEDCFEPVCVLLGVTEYGYHVLRLEKAQHLFTFPFFSWLSVVTVENKSTARYQLRSVAQLQLPSFAAHIARL